MIRAGSVLGSRHERACIVTLSELRAPERPTAPVAAKALILMLALAGFALTMVALFPGHMTTDAAYIYGYIREWRFGDWQSPVMSILWALIDPISPGPGSMFLLVATLYWLGFALVGVTIARRSCGFGLAVPLLALLPPSFMMLG